MENSKKFKVLEHSGLWVEITNNGLFARKEPHLYSENETIETLIEKAMKLNATERYIEGLKMCKLREIDIEKYKNFNCIFCD